MSAWLVGSRTAKEKWLRFALCLCVSTPAFGLNGTGFACLDTLIHGGRVGAARHNDMVSMFCVGGERRS